MSRNVVFDTSTLVSAALGAGSIPFLALRKAQATYDLCACAQTLDESEGVLDREKFDRYLDKSSRRDFVALMRRNSHLFSISDAELTSIDPPRRDVEDNKFLALALAADASLLLTSDEDLLVLHPWQSVRDFHSRGISVWPRISQRSGSNPLNKRQGRLKSSLVVQPEFQFF